MDPIKPPVRQAHPMMATPQPPTRLTVSGGPKATPHLSQPTDHRHRVEPVTIALVAMTVVIAVLVVLLVLS